MLGYIINSFSCSKAGNSPDENEDSFVAPPNENLDGYFRIAVADGATESSFSKEWASLLVSYFYAFDFENESFINSIHPVLKKSWLKMINAIDLPWYAQQKLELGAFASFLGVDVNLGSGECNLMAVGDSNLFVFRNNVMVISFPVEKAKNFSSTPFLISSDLHKNTLTESFFSREVFPLIAGDAVILGTDAIGQWILSEVESQRDPLNTLYPLLVNNDHNDSFELWLTEQRNSHKIKNDDTTIILIQFSDGTTER